MPRVDYDQGKYVSPVLMWIIIIAGVIVAFLFFGQQRLFDRSLFSWIFLAAALVYWAFFFFGAVRINHAVARSAAKVDQLAKAGVYNLVRHPIYTADIVLAWGLFFFFPLKAMLLSVLWLTFVMILWIFLEERALIKRFGSEYLNYVKQVPMLIPSKVN